ncbi:ABC transporter permease subunit [Paramicrobacterium chengjingii]|uniref:ABC transporter permease n=1 Tax=Paramicrobacterium chengjingii TaxID=2769067 RepID=UPI001422E97A|nr:ABC transporter permease subunit [Microbacterium chengjingii]
MRSSRNYNAFVYGLFLTPLLALLVIFLAYPIVLSVSTSFQAGNSGNWIGTGNYDRFFADPASGQLVFNSFVRGIGGVVPSYLLGLVAALALNRAVRGRAALRLFILIPFVISAPVGLGMWKLLLDPYFGVPAALGLDIENVFSNADIVWFVLLGINAWASFQFYTMLLLAGLSSVPEERYEAARVDGAGLWQRFRHITLPGITAVTVAACGLHFINSFQEFNLVYILTGGGPLGATQTLATDSYVKAFSNYDNGYATTLTTVSIVVMVAAIVVILAFGWILSRLRLMVGPYLPEIRMPRFRPSAPGSLARQGRVMPAVTAIVMAVVSMAPILFVLSRSLDGSPGGSEAVSIIPREWTLSNFVTVLTSPALWDSSGVAVPPLAFNFMNSIVVTFCVTAIVLFVSMFGGYALSRLTGWVSKFVVALLVFFQLVPVIVLVFPLYEILSSMGLLGTQIGQVLATSVLFISMGTLFFRVFFDNVPREIEESASLDGAGPVRILLQIVRPLAKPVIGAMAAYTLINSWNEYLLATTLISDSTTRTFPAALQQFMSSYNFTATTTPGQQAVYLLIPIIAAIILLALTQRQLAAAYEGGAVKG